MLLSQSKTKEAKKLKVSSSELVFADLLTIGYSEEDAYVIAFHSDKNLKQDKKEAVIRSIVESPRFKQFRDIRRKKNAGFLSVTNEASDLELLSAEDVAKEVLLAAKQQPAASKERADLMIKYNDIRNENKSEIADPNTDPVRFFLPIACEKCPLLQRYNEYLAEKNKDQPEDKWDLELRPDEMQMIIEQAHPEIKKRRKAEN